MNKLPDFFNYKEEDTDSGYEAIQDFFLSWTLRCAQESNKTLDYPKLHEYSKNILLELIFDNEIPEKISVQSVKTKRQWNLIDLLVEVKLDINGNTEEYILNIENKWYTSIRNGQLEKSKEKLLQDNYYKKLKLINIIIIPDYEKIDELKEISKKLNYKIKVIEDLITETNKTGNHLFDEYWFNF